jgi:hypothetical protein
MRQPKPWFRKSVNAWYVQIDGQKVRLVDGEENEQEAIAEFYRRMAHKPGHIPEPSKLTVAHLCDLFLASCEGEVEPSTFDGYRDFLQSFCRECGKMNCLAIKPYHVNAWIKKHPTWKGARRHAIGAVKRVYSWAKKEGLLETNPVESLETPASQPRKQALSKEQCEEILKQIKSVRKK